MLTEKIQAALAAREKETSEIRERINDLAASRKEAAAAVRAALKEKNMDGIVEARRQEDRIEQELAALKMIETEINRARLVDHETFRQEYAEFFAQQQGDLDETYSKITAGLAELETAYHNYDGVYQRYLAQLRAWQDLAGKIGLVKPTELQNKTNSAGHRSAKNALTMLRPTGGF